MMTVLLLGIEVAVVAGFAEVKVTKLIGRELGGTVVQFA
jgi:hypothetical protein